MKLRTCSALALLLCACALAAPGTPAQARKARPKPVAKAAQKASQEAPKLSAEEVQSPYSALVDGAGNATRWDFDPEPRGRPFGQGQAEDQRLRLRLGRDEAVDPITRRDLLPPADPQKAKESLKQLDVKDALDKMRGKAEVQVEVLKF